MPDQAAASPAAPHCPVLSDAALRDIQQRNRDHPGWVLSPVEAWELLLADAERINQEEKT